MYVKLATYTHKDVCKHMGCANQLDGCAHLVISMSYICILFKKKKEILNLKSQTRSTDSELESAS